MTTTNNVNVSTEASKVAELVHESVRKPQILKVTHDGLEAEILMTPDGEGGWTQETAKSVLKDYEKHPERRKGTARFTDLESFIEHTKRFKDEHSLVFLNRPDGTAPSLISVLDYHEKNATGAPRYGEHRGVYTFPLSEPWMAWARQNKQWMNQETFAQWIEDRILDIIDPSNAGDSVKPFLAALECSFAAPNKLLALSRGLEVHVGQKVKQHTRLSTGEASIQFEEEHTDKQGAPLNIPQAFLLGIPVFRNEDPWQLAARLRYRVNAGQVTWSFELHRQLDVYDAALAGAVQEVADSTRLDVLEGTPEA